MVLCCFLFTSGGANEDETSSRGTMRLDDDVFLMGVWYGLTPTRPPAPSGKYLAGGQRNESMNTSLATISVDGKIIIQL